MRVGAVVMWSQSDRLGSSGRPEMLPRMSLLAVFESIPQTHGSASVGQKAFNVISAHSSRATRGMGLLPSLTGLASFVGSPAVPFAKIGQHAILVWGLLFLEYGSLKHVDCLEHSPCRRPNQSVQQLGACRPQALHRSDQIPSRDRIYDPFHESVMSLVRPRQLLFGSSLGAVHTVASQSRESDRTADG